VAVWVSENKIIFLSKSSPSSSRGNISLMLILVEGLGFVLLGFLILHLSFSYANHVFYILLAVAVFSLAIGFHIILALAVYVTRSRR
jgi:apolipoprotein N-acyltransferase